MGALREDAKYIYTRAIEAVLPDEAVRRALDGADFPGRVILVAAGKAAWRMASAAVSALGERIDTGIVITKYGHAQGTIPGVVCREAGHPVPDENSFSAAREALALTENLTADDTVLFLLSGGGSALFESPLVSGAELQDITAQLLACGADIVEINTIRKRLSAVKGGRFARHCAPAHVFAVILSDIVGDPVDMIASGPVSPDSSTCADALTVAEKYALRLSDTARRLLAQETPKTADNVTVRVTGSVRELCAAAAKACRDLGYTPEILTDCEQGVAARAGECVLRHAAGVYPRRRNGRPAHRERQGRAQPGARARRRRGDRGGRKRRRILRRLGRHGRPDGRRGRPRGRRHGRAPCRGRKDRGGRAPK